MALTFIMGLTIVMVNAILKIGKGITNGRYY